MAFLDETGLETLWDCVKEEVAKKKVVTGTFSGGSTGGSTYQGSVTLESAPKLVVLNFVSASNGCQCTPIVAPATGKYITFITNATSADSATVGAYQSQVTINGATVSCNWNKNILGTVTVQYTAFL